MLARYERVRPYCTKEMIAPDDGHRESTGSWADLLRSCNHRATTCRVSAVGGNASGFWALTREVFPDAAGP